MTGTVIGAVVGGAVVAGAGAVAGAVVSTGVVVAAGAVVAGGGIVGPVEAVVAAGAVPSELLTESDREHAVRASNATADTVIATRAGRPREPRPAGGRSPIIGSCWHVER
ncbi:MAG: hypothetical protein QNJ12_00495 [Ilumatobacter sp.]|uniref:hypothetical protein n=1 Tax=Ilumatobacter sp. TaxID=1967498 RepID=UPI0026146471|nr:hypothetical protein [Ilumatobacter sp.]MDJ0767230.1 hypothetical protein [Ilumatobacter sp.]